MQPSNTDATNPQQENQVNYYQIESGIPFQHTNTRRFKNLAHQMKVGDSVLLQMKQERRSLLVALAYAGMKGQSRKTNKGFRVWRVK